MKNKKILFIIAPLTIVIVVAFLGWLVAISGEDESPVELLSQGVLSAQESKFDFGTISMQNGKVEYDFKVKNEGEEPVAINKVYTSCMCTTAFFIDPDGKKYGGFGMPGHGLSKTSSDIVVGPGQEATVKAVFDPAAHGPSGVGLVQRSVFLETNSTQSPMMEFNFDAVVTR